MVVAREVDGRRRDVDRDLDPRLVGAPPSAATSDGGVVAVTPVRSVPPSVAVTDTISMVPLPGVAELTVTVQVPPVVVQVVASTSATPFVSVT